MSKPTKSEARHTLKMFLVEFVVYGSLVVGYFFLVLDKFGASLNYLYEHNRKGYAWAALGLIIGQGVALDLVTRFLSAFLKPRGDD